MNRPDWDIVTGWIGEGAGVLDLGCGDGALLRHLIAERSVRGVGMEVDDERVARGVAADLNIVQADLDDGIRDWFGRHSFDYVLVSQTIQAIRHPERLLGEMLDIASEGIVTFPNMGYWRNRWQLGVQGMMPTTKALPNPWYNTPNIHLCTLRDFESLCEGLGIEILDRAVVDQNRRSSPLLRALPHWFGEHAIYRIRKRVV
ncbi:methionine biosynthesis protein MetW [Guyparkeria halopsychrophila]|uniref:methionine biosynthesis protein MetW n=1 Tax=Guyparkeria halopsychrophila TaxID=3139421 RepID=UPI0037C92308